MSTSYRIVKNTSYLYAKMLISIFVSLLTTRIVLDSLGASDMGIFGVLGSAIAMLGFINTSMAFATQRFMNYQEGKGDLLVKKRIYNASVVIHFFISVFIVVVFLLIEPVVFDYLVKIDTNRLFAARWVYRFSIFSTFFTIITVPYDAVINSHENMFFYSLVGVIDVFLKLFVAFFISITVYDKLIMYGLLMTIVSVATFLMMYCYCVKKYEECIFAPKKYFDYKLLKQVMSFGGWNLVGTSSTMLSNYGVNIVVNNFFGTVLNATLSICTQLTSQLLALSTNLMKAANPVIVKKEGAGQRLKMYEITFTACKLSYITYVVIAVPFLLECEFILRFWLKEVPPYCLQFCQLTFFLKLIEQITTPLNTTISAVGKIKQYNIVISIFQFFQVALLVLFFMYGLAPYYCVVAMIVSAFMCSVYKILYCKKYMSMDYLFFIHSIVIRCLLHSFISICVGFLILCLMQEGLIRLLVVGFVTLFFNVFLFYAYLLQSNEREITNSVLINILGKLKPIIG